MAIIPESESEFNSFFYRNIPLITIIAINCLLIVTLSWPLYESQKLQLSRNDLKLKIKNLESTPEFQKVIEYKDLKNKRDEIQKINQSKLSVFAILRLIENITLPQLVFNRFAINAEQGSVNLSGTASSYASLALQIENFEREKMIKSVVVKNPTRNENSIINFNLNFVLK